MHVYYYSNVSAPGPVMVTALCSAVVWQAPATPNGVITRYEVDLGGAVMPLPADRFFIETSEQQQNSNIPARVRSWWYLRLYLHDIFRHPLLTQAIVFPQID